MEEIEQHNNAGACWIVAHGNVYDATEFLDCMLNLGALHCHLIHILLWRLASIIVNYCWLA